MRFAQKQAQFRDLRFFFANERVRFAQKQAYFCDLRLFFTFERLNIFP